MGKTRKPVDPPFITPYERRQRIEAVLEYRGWKWYNFAQAARMSQSSLQRAFKVEPGTAAEPSLKSLRRVADALGVTIGFLTDRGKSDVIPKWIRKGE